MLFSYVVHSKKYPKMGAVGKMGQAKNVDRMKRGDSQEKVIFLIYKKLLVLRQSQRFDPLPCLYNP